MLTWILIAVIVAALFGVINFDHIREWSIERSKEAWPECGQRLWSRLAACES